MKETIIKVELGSNKREDAPLTKGVVRIGSKYYYKDSNIITLVSVGSKRRYFRKVSPLIVEIEGIYYRRNSIKKVDGKQISVDSAKVVKCYDGEYHLKTNCIYSEEDKWMYMNSEKAIKKVVFCAISGKAILPEDAIAVYDVEFIEGSLIKNPPTKEYTIKVNSKGVPQARRVGASAKAKEVKSDLTNLRYVEKQYAEELVQFKGRAYLKNECVKAYDNGTDKIDLVPYSLCKAPKYSVFEKFNSDWSGDFQRCAHIGRIVEYGGKAGYTKLELISEITLPFTDAIMTIGNYFGSGRIYVMKKDIELFRYSALYFFETNQGSLSRDKLKEYARVLATNADDFKADLASLSFSNRGAADILVSLGKARVSKKLDDVGGMPFSVGIEVETSGGSIDEDTIQAMGFSKVGDRSIGAYEYISPILGGNTIMSVLEEVNSAFTGQVMFDKRCSTHVHVGTYNNKVLQKELHNPNFQIAVLKLGAHIENEWFDIMPSYRYKERYHCYSIAPYKGINTANSDNLLGAYCFGGHEQSMSKHDRRTRWSLKDGGSSASRWGGSRYKWLNIVGLLKPYASQRTIEFRLFPGTTNKEELSLYTLMSMSFVNFALNNTENILKDVTRVNTELILRESIKDYKLLHKTLAMLKSIRKINKAKIA